MKDKETEMEAGIEHDDKFDFVGHDPRRALPRRRRVRSSRSSLFEERDEVHVLRLEPIAWARRGAYICRFFLLLLCGRPSLALAFERLPLVWSPSLPPAASSQ